MDTKILLLVVSLFFSSHQHKLTDESGFLFTMTKVLRAGSKAEFCLTLFSKDHNNFDDKKTTHLVKLRFVKTGINYLEVGKTFEVGKQACGQFQVPEPGDYSLRLSNHTGPMHKPVSVTVHGSKLMTFVQTDKPIYKPGQKVKFRVLTLTSDMKPRVGKIYSIFIMDPNVFRVKQYLDVETKGISSLEFQLSPEAKLGEWHIEVKVNKTDEKYREITTIPFEVKEYVLPRFEVEIIPPSYILANQKTASIQVCAKYTYGKNVTGILDLEVCYGSPYMIVKTCSKEVVKMTGCHSYQANISKIAGDRSHFFNYELQIHAGVTEDGTAFTVNKSHSGPSLTYEPLKIQLEDYSNGFFKPGLPFYGKAIITKPDGTPAEGEGILIKAVDTNQNKKFSQVFTTDSSGIIVFSLCGSFTEESKAISINAEAFMYPYAEGLHTPMAFRQIQQWFSPSLSYLQIPRSDSQLKCGDRLSLNIPFTTQEASGQIKFNYQVMALGKIIQSGQVLYDGATDFPGEATIPQKSTCLQDAELTHLPEVTPPESEEDDETETQSSSSMHKNFPLPPFGRRFDYDQDGSVFISEEPVVRSENVSRIVSSFPLDLPVQPQMSPSFTLLVYHILQDKEVVADSMQFQVIPCFQNEVSMTFNSSSVLPGQTVDITLRAAPGSVCGVGVVDKSVNLLGGKHQITPDKVFKKIEELNNEHFVDYSSRYREETYCNERMRKFKGNDESWSSTSSKFVDAMQAFTDSGFFVLSNLMLETRPCGSETVIMYQYYMHRIPAYEDSMGPLLGMPMPMPGAPLVNSVAVPTVSAKLQTTKVRTNFPETWLWDLYVVSDSGETTLQETAPHTVTSWTGNALCLDQGQGLGISQLTSLTTFQPFFLSMQLPYAAVRAERLPILVTVYNYLQKCLHIQITLDVGLNFKIHNAKLYREPVCVCGGASYTARVYATPIQIGSLDLLAKAEIVPGLCGNTLEVDTSYVGLADAVQRKMLVKAEGVEQQYTHTSYLCSTDAGTKDESVILPLPAEEEMVKDSARGEVTVIGDIMGPALTNLNNLVRMPTGCGEQNMVGFVPNILVLQYLTSIGKVTDEIHKTAVNFMEVGYQKQLNYRHHDGSFSAFGKNDPRGSIWLTAFVVKSFAQAKPYVYISENDLTLSLQFLRHNQLETGCFRETGKVFQSYMMGGLGKDKDSEPSTALTAYVLIAFLTANISTTEPVIVGAMDCIQSDFKLRKERIDPYTLSLVAYAHSLFDPRNKNGHEVLNVLESKAHRNGSLKYWSRETLKPKPVNSWFYPAAPSAEVEMTSYVLMAYLNIFGQRAIERTHDIAMWLSQQRNPNGGFSSTQDTVVGLQALSEYAGLAFVQGGTELQVSVSGSKLNRTFQISEKEQTTLLLQSVDIPVLPDELRITATGSGCALVQSSVRFNKLAKDINGGDKPSFHLKVSTRKYQHDIDKCDRQTLAFSVGKKGGQELNNGMSLLSVKMVTSWRPVPESLVKLESLFPILGIKRHEYSEDLAILTLYFDELSKTPKEFTLDVEQDQDLTVSNPKPADVKLFQYYEADVSTVASYHLKTICGTKEEIPRNVTETEYEDGIIPQMRLDLSLVPAEGRNTAASSSRGCPVCIATKHQPKNLSSLVCNSTAIYKGAAGKPGTSGLRLRQNLLNKTKLNKNAQYVLPAGCDCTVLEAPVKQVLIFVDQELTPDRRLLLGKSSTVLRTNKKIENSILNLKKSCQT